jgi:tetratricopeptide (TPR) repeat protein
MVDSTDTSWAAIFRTRQLVRAREFYSDMPVKDSVLASGIKLRKPDVTEYPFQFDNLVTSAEMAAEDGDFKLASQIYDYTCEHYRSDTWMMTRCANELYFMGDNENAARLASEINAVTPTVSTYLIEARAMRQMGNIESAIKLFERAEEILEGNSCGTMRFSKA